MKQNSEGKHEPKGLLAWCIQHEMIIRVAVSAITALIVCIMCR